MLQAAAIQLSPRDGWMKKSICYKHAFRCYKQQRFNSVPGMDEWKRAYVTSTGFDVTSSTESTQSPGCMNEKEDMLQARVSILQAAANQLSPRGGWMKKRICHKHGFRCYKQQRFNSVKGMDEWKREYVTSTGFDVTSSSASTQSPGWMNEKEDSLQRCYKSSSASAQSPRLMNEKEDSLQGFGWKGNKKQVRRQQIWMEWFRMKSTQWHSIPRGWEVRMP